MADPSKNIDSTFTSNPLKHDLSHNNDPCSFTSDPARHEAQLNTGSNLNSNPLKHDPSLNTVDFAFTSNSQKDRKEEVREEWLLRPRPAFRNNLNIEDVDSKYKETILALPKEERWATSTLRLYKGLWVFERTLPGILTMEEAFEIRPSDVIMASFVKSGTTWLKALTFTIAHRNKFSLSCHPLLKLNPHDCVPITEHHFAVRDEQYLETLPSPRVLGFHLSYSILPECIKKSECPIIYICREPKDVLVSVWHMETKFEWVQKPFPFNEAFELFCEGRIPYGPVWDHALEYYNESLIRPDKILFLKYEEMMMDPIDGAMRLASFIGCPFSEEEVKNGVVEGIVEFCSFNKLKNLDVNKSRAHYNENSIYFRKAAVEDWQNHMTTEMATRLDEIIKEKLHNSGFTFGVNHKY